MRSWRINVTIIFLFSYEVKTDSTEVIDVSLICETFSAENFLTSLSFIETKLEERLILNFCRSSDQHQLPWVLWISGFAKYSDIYLTDILADSEYFI